MCTVAMVRGVVREWHDAEGWGVIDSADTPGGCWAHFSALRVPGYRSARPGQTLTFEYEEGSQNGFEYRAIRVDIDGIEPAEPEVNTDGGTALHSQLFIQRPSDPSPT